ncbi:unnamed protein product [Nippostrongylus brasiliensis]|uniref:Ig-like domain-containing protein n=1 Tax=Nippostrongylus brasiliensis TaxID=27835 RepID=A0A0N4YIZ2_NIPBR|nr:unnamed protein product [Nippostrongylus brasiliensis]
MSLACRISMEHKARGQDVTLCASWRMFRKEWASDYIASRRRVVAEAQQGAAAFECARASPDGRSTALLTSRLYKVSNAALFPSRGRTRKDFGSGARVSPHARECESGGRREREGQYGCVRWP